MIYASVILNTVNISVSGWYRIEDIGGAVARWANETATMRIALPEEDITMTFVATPFLEGQSVEIVVNDILIDTIDITEVWGTFQVVIPSTAITENNISRIEFHHTLAEYPENHNRRLAVAYRDFHFE